MPTVDKSSISYPLTAKQANAYRDQVESLCVSVLLQEAGWQQRLAYDVATLVGGLCRPAFIKTSIPSDFALTYLPFAHSIAGNVPLLKQGHGLPRWLGEEVLMCAQVLSVLPNRFSGKSYVGFYEVGLDLLSGPGAGQPIVIRMPDFLVRSFAAQCRGKKKNPPDPLDFAGMIFTGYFAHSSRGGYEVRELTMRSSEILHNKKLQKARASGCIKHLYPVCSFCEFGRDECLLAYHTGHLATGTCVHKKCGQPNQFITKDGLCIHCVRLGRYLPKPPKKEKETENDQQPTGTDSSPVS